jgi:hypothetical protein
MSATPNPTTRFVRKLQLPWKTVGDVPMHFNERRRLRLRPFWRPTFYQAKAIECSWRMGSKGDFRFLIRALWRLPDGLCLSKN